MKTVLAPFYDSTLDQSRMRQFNFYHYRCLNPLYHRRYQLFVPAQNECSDFPKCLLVHFIVFGNTFSYLSYICI